MKKSSILLITLVITAAAFFLKGKIAHEKFDSEVWKTANLNSEENWSLRWDMMNDLRNRYDLVGMTRTEVLDLLGTPETITSSEFIYYPGYSKRGINTGSLTITFNQSNIVTDIRVWQG